MDIDDLKTLKFELYVIVNPIIMPINIKVK